MLRVSIRLIADVVLVAFLLFISAGTLAWPHAWVLLAAMIFVRTLGAIAVFRISPELISERARMPFHREQHFADRVLLLGVLATGFLGLPAIAGLDVFRWRALPAPTPIVANLGILLFIVGWTIKNLALRANAFAVTVVRLQSERAHTVVDSGPYAVVRHPFYAADPLIFLGLSLWLQSYVAAICAVFPLALIVMRLRLEESFLRRELSGYAAYTSRVRFRLIPGVW